MEEGMTVMVEVKTMWGTQTVMGTVTELHELTEETRATVEGTVIAETVTGMVIEKSEPVTLHMVPLTELKAVE